MSFFKSLFGSKQTPNNSTSQEVNRIEYNEDEFDIDGTVLRRYKGTQDSFKVPRGVRRISNVEYPICEHSIDTIYIPRSVTSIGDSALAYCESVWYEGSEQEWKQIRIDAGNFTTGWRPDWCKNNSMMQSYRVTEVKFHYNTYSSLWDE